MIRKIICIPITLIAVLIGQPQLMGATPAVKVDLVPDAINIGTFFNGTQLSVSGRIAADNDVIVVVNGKNESVTLKKKGKIFGLLWMNKGDVHFDKVPSLYLLYSSERIMDFKTASPEKFQKWGVGFDHLKKQMEISAPLAERDKWAVEYVKLKQSRELYASYPDKITFDTNKDAEKAFSVDVRIPSLIKPGEYQVQVLEINDGNIAGRTMHSIKVKEQGIPYIMSTLAFNHSILYGVLAALVAIVAGLIMTFLFGEGGGGSH